VNETHLDGTQSSLSHGPQGPAGDVLALIGEVERHLERIRHAQEAGAARAAAAEERFRSLEVRESQVAERTEAIESARTMILGRERELATERETLAGLRDELASRESTLRDRALALRSEAERVERESNAARGLAAEADSRCRALTVERDTLAAERDAAHSAVEHLRQDAVAAQDRRSQLESRLAEFESRGRALDAALAAKDAELAVSRQALEAAVSKLTTLAAAVAAYAPQVERVAAAGLPGPAGPTVDLAPLHSRIAELESLLASVRNERTGLEAELSPLRDRLADLESELVRAAAVPTSAAVEPVDSSVQREFALRLEEKGRRIAELAGFLRTRKARLDRLHAMLKSRSSGSAVAAPLAPVGASAARIAEETRLADLRERLQSAADRLADTEQAMVGRYAHARAPIVAAWTVLALVTLAMLSWAAAGAIFPPSSLATCDLVAAVPGGGSLESSKLAPWDAKARALVTDPATIESVRTRLADRGLGDLPLESWLSTVRMDSTGPGVLRLSATADGDARAVAALDTLATSVAAASRQATATVEGLPKVEIAGASVQPGQVSFAKAVPVPDTAARLGRAAAIFSGLVAVGLTIGFLAHRSIVRGRRLLDDESIVA
jgi:predicted  nucleic acid-binding Zn-ribbon protein